MLDVSQQLAIGIDIGGTNTKYGLVNHRGEILEKGEIRTDAYPKIDSFINALYEKLMPLIDSVEDPKKVKGIGIGAPNGNYYKGTIEYAPNLHWKGIIHL